MSRLRQLNYSCSGPHRSAQRYNYEATRGIFASKQSVLVLSLMRGATTDAPGVGSVDVKSSCLISRGPGLLMRAVLANVRLPPVHSLRPRASKKRGAPDIDRIFHSLVNEPSEVAFFNSWKPQFGRSLGFEVEV